MARKRKKEKKISHNLHLNKQKSSIKSYLLWILIIIPAIAFVFIVGYYIGFKSALHQTKHTRKVENISHSTNKETKDIINDTQKRLELLKKSDVVEKVAIIKPIKENNKIYTSALHEFDEKTDIPPQNIKRKIQVVQQKPKLAIIIDDVSTKSQVKAIKSLHIPITMSFLPPSSARPNSAKLASKENFYMVHLPMEAQHFTAEEPLTLRVSDSQKKISSRIKELKTLFPRVKYINNHTGSKFTADEKAMNRLIYSLNKNKITFIDSRTTAKTKAPKVLKNFGKKYISRDVFLDNKSEKHYILGQVKKAIRIAKKYGSAIAICHPHPTTILALHAAKNLFKDVELVYINNID